jgi:hypothetical protein
MVDLGLELVGVAVLGALALACATARRGAPAAREGPARAFAIGGLSTLTLAVSVLAAPVMRDHLPYADRELRNLLAAEDLEGFDARLRSAMRMHPAAPVPAVLGASEALRRNRADALSWINHSQALAPGWALPHMFAAQWLWNRGHHDQALLELSIAARVDLYGSRVLACAIARRDPSGILGIAGKTADPETFLELAQQCVGRDSEAGLVLEDGLARSHPDAPGPWLRSLSRRLGRGEAAQVLTTVRAAPASLRSARGAAELEVRALLALGRSDEALAQLRRAGSGPEAADLLRLEVEVLTARKDVAGLGAAFQRLRGLATNPGDLADAYRLEAGALLALGRSVSAVSAYEQAYRVTGDTKLLREAARLAARLGDTGRARDAHARLCALDPGDHASCEASHAPDRSP